MRQFIFMTLITITTAVQGIANAEYFDVGDGINMYYETHGTGGTPLVLIHGSFGSTSTFNEILPIISTSRQVIAIDMQGHGRTNDTDRPFSYVNFATDISKLLTHLQIVKADVLGYSLGGTVALQFGILFPNQTNKIVVISSTFKFDGWSKDVQDELKSLTPEFFYNTPIQAEYLKLSPHPEKFDDFVRKLAAFDSQPFNLGEQNIQNMSAPLLLLMGDNDGVNLEASVELYKLAGGGIFGDANGLPASELAIVPNTTHVSLISETGLITQFTTEFLDKPGIEILPE